MISVLRSQQSLRKFGSQRIRVHNARRLFSAVALQHDKEHFLRSQSTNGAFESSAAEPDIKSLQPKTNVNLVTSINRTLSRILETDPSAILFGQVRCKIFLSNILKMNESILAEGMTYCMTYEYSLFPAHDSFH